MDKMIEKRLTNLLELQAIDTQLEGILKMRGSLPKEVVALEDKLAALQLRLQHTKEELTNFEQDIVVQKKKIKEITLLVQKYEEQQMNVRNNREYDAITKEIDLQKLESQLAEKRIRACYESIEKGKAAVEETNASLATKKQALSKKQAELQAVMAASEAEEQSLGKKRTQLIKGIEKDSLNGYETIRANVHNKIAVVTVKREACGGCFIILPPQQQIEIQKKQQINTCEHCGRIIAAVEDPLEAEEEVAS